jgi:hypothetical protein
MNGKLTRTLALTAAIGAAAAPAASAMPIGPDPAGGAAFSQDTPQTLVVKTVKQGGFDLGDAAIGAGVAAIVLLAGGGGTLALRARRPLPQ